MEQLSFRGPVESLDDAIDVIIANDMDVVGASALHATDDVATMILIARGQGAGAADRHLRRIGWHMTDPATEAFAAA